MNQYQTAAATANIPVPTAASNANVTSDVSSMAKPGASKDSEIENEHTDVAAEAEVPTANTSSESTSTLTGTNSNELTAESSLRDETESSSEQENCYGDVGYKNFHLSSVE